MKDYQKPELDILRFSAKDVIVCSGGPNPSGNNQGEYVSDKP